MAQYGQELPLGFFSIAVIDFQVARKPSCI